MQEQSRAHPSDAEPSRLTRINKFKASVERLREGFDLAGEQRSIGMDAIRGLVALSVCVYHFAECGCYLFSPAWTQAGALRTNFFFTLSAFLLTLSVMRPKAPEWRGFLKKRAARILPPYYVALFLCVFLVSPSSADLTSASLSSAIGNITSHLTLLHGWFSQFRVGIMGPYWSLTQEVSFYLFLAAIFPLLRKENGWLIPASMLGLGFLLRLGSHKGWWDLYHNHPLQSIDQFGAGMLVAWLAPKLKPKWILLFAALGAAYVVYSIGNIHEIALKAAERGTEAQKLSGKVKEMLAKRTSLRLWMDIGCALGAGFLLLSVRNFPAATRWLRFTPLPFLGKISYSLYLYHMPVALCLLRGVKHPPAGSAWESPGFRFCATLSCSIIFAAWAYWQWERPHILGRTGIPRR
jgi:peptidoglycan/LPS O-acetylase OafA/YrhL